MLSSTRSAVLRPSYRPTFDVLEDRLALSAVSAWQPAVPVRAPEAQVRSISPEQDSSGVSAARYALLAHSINISLWFRFPASKTPDHFTNFITDADLKLIKDLGFTSVRLAIDPNLLYRSARPTRLNPAVLPFVDQAVTRILNQGLGVIVDMHDEKKTPFEDDPTYANGFIKFWKKLAGHFGQFDPERVFLEALNEPVYDGHPRDWLQYQKRLLKAIRQGAPLNTIIATGPSFSSLDGLLKVKPVADSNVIYTFHFYEPFPFTHQGADFVEKPYRFLANLPYPSSPEGVAAILGGIGNKKAQKIAIDYGNERWDAGRIEARLSQAVAWARQYNVKLFAGEFGVYCVGAPYADKLRYLKDLQTGFSRQGIAWSLWSYEECFGLNRMTANGQISVDMGVVGALGVQPKP